MFQLICGGECGGDLSSERTANIGDTTKTPFIGCCNVAKRYAEKLKGLGRVKQFCLVITDRNDE